jgi:hypothetical protein
LTGITLITGTGANDTAVTMAGRITDINAALEGLVLSPAAGFSGRAALTISVSDLGSSGAGGAQSVTAAVAVEVMPSHVNPSAGAAATQPEVPHVNPDTDADNSSATPTQSPNGQGNATGNLPPAGGQPPATGAIASEEAEPVSQGSTSASAAGSVPFGSAAQTGDTRQPSRTYRHDGATLATESYILPGLTQNEEAATLSPFSFSNVAAIGTRVAESLQNETLGRELEALREELRERTAFEVEAVAVSAAASLGLSVGYVIWLLRGGVLLSSLLSTLPAWRLVDPLPVLGRLEEEDDAEDAPDESLESLVERNNSAAAATAPSPPGQEMSR